MNQGKWFCFSLTGSLYMVCSRGFESWQDPGGLLDELPTLTQPWRTA